jgi:hypothetical protein
MMQNDFLTPSQCWDSCLNLPACKCNLDRAYKACISTSYLGEHHENIAIFYNKFIRYSGNF